MEINKIHLGDAYELIKQIPDKSVDLIVTDPPYLIEGIHTGTGVLKNRKHSHVEEFMENDNIIVKGVDLKILDEFVRVMKRINIYLWCNKEQIYDYLTYFVKERDCAWEMIIWGKTNPPPFSNGHYLKDKEYCLFFHEKGIQVSPSFETGKTVYISQTNTTDKEQFGHPTIKPLDIIKNLIVNSSGGGDLILDPFIGSGTTAVACKELGRNFIGFEINERFHDIAVSRVNGAKKIIKTKTQTIEQLSLF